MQAQANDETHLSLEQGVQTPIRTLVDEATQTDEFVRQVAEAAHALDVQTRAELERLRVMRLANAGEGADAADGPARRQGTTEPIPGDPKTRACDVVVGAKTRQAAPRPDLARRNPTPTTRSVV